MSYLFGGWVEWLEKETELKQIKKDYSWLWEITLPFVDRHNDKVQIYLNYKIDDSQNYEEIVISDGGYVINDLKTGGYDLERGKFAERYISVLRWGGIRVREGELFISVKEKDFTNRMNTFIQVLVIINYLTCIILPEREEELPHSKEFNWYQEHKEELIEKYRGKVIVIKNKKVIGVYEDELTAVKDMVRKGKNLGEFLVKRCEHGADKIYIKYSIN